MHSVKRWSVLAENFKLRASASDLKTYIFRVYLLTLYTAQVFFGLLFLFLVLLYFKTRKYLFHDVMRYKEANTCHF